jgi:hypothetical protein
MIGPDGEERAAAAEQLSEGEQAPAETAAWDGEVAEPAAGPAEASEESGEA